MTNKTLTRADLLHAVYVTGPGLSRVEAKQIVEIAIDEVCSALETGETVKLRSFGTFHVRSKRPRVGRNPKTGKEYPITARRVLTFKPSPRLIASVNGEEFTGKDGDEDEADTPSHRPVPARRAADL